MRIRRHGLAGFTIAALALASTALPQAAAAQSPIDALSGRYIALLLRTYPELVPLSGIEGARQSALPPIDSESLKTVASEEDRLWQDLNGVDEAKLDEAGRASYALMADGLEAARAQRVCKQPLWSISHMTGWQVNFSRLAQAQATGTPDAREDAIRRWESLPAYVDRDIANLREGLKQGYAVPRSVVTRVIGQLDRLLALPAEQSPFYAPARADGDAAFKARFKTIVAEGVHGAVKRYRDFLAGEYLPKAREGIALSELPNGAACYQALLRASTTLDRTPAEVMAVGEAAVAQNVKDIIAIGSKRFGTSDLASTLAAVKDAPDNHFTTADALVDFSKRGLARTTKLSAAAFQQLPKQPAAIEVLPATEAGSGVPAHYLPEPDPSKPGRYMLPLDHWKTETKGGAEITVVHETIPGHHLQIAMTQELAAKVPLLRIPLVGAYVEGWARYSERLAEELGVYETPYAGITRRAWMARGMVVDPGIHAFGWSREKAMAYLVESGRFDEAAAADMLDRIAVIPGQLTSYDSGGLEIAALRAETEASLGKCFNLPAFHQQVLAGGALPLKALRSRVEAWQAATGKACAK
jgi:uncharacterized protein (DUF885 family)